jgi:hypothetical protein
MPVGMIPNHVPGALMFTIDIPAVLHEFGPCGTGAGAERNGAAAAATGAAAAGWLTSAVVAATTPTNADANLLFTTCSF